MKDILSREADRSMARVNVALPRGSRALNLGCGLTGIAGEGWINMDNSPNAWLSKYPRLKWLLWKSRLLSDFHYNIHWDKSIVIRDLRKRLPFDDDSIRYVYTSHFLEHVSRGDAKRVIGEIRRVLEPGGILRVVVPDLAYGVRRYTAAIQADPSDADAAPRLLEWLQLSAPGRRDPHLWMYDGPSLSKLLADSGLINVTPCDYKQGRVPDCDVLDARPEDSVHVEAEKG
jgi:SAM-dependent methyltransferase